MITRVLISGLSKETVDRIDRALGGAGWRFDIRKNGLYDVDVNPNYDVLYVSNENAVNAIVIGAGELTAGIKRNEFNSIIAG